MTGIARLVYRPCPKQNRRKQVIIIRVKSFLPAEFLWTLGSLGPRRRPPCSVILVLCHIAAAVRPPTDWGRPVGRQRTTWLKTTDEDVQPQNFGDLGSMKEGKRYG